MAAQADKDVEQEELSSIAGRSANCTTTLEINLAGSQKKKIETLLYQSWANTQNMLQHLKNILAQLCS